MLIDTHVHLDADEFTEGPNPIVHQAREQGVGVLVVPAVHPDNFEKVRALAHAHEGVYFALGIHPMYVHQADDTALEALSLALSHHRNDPKLVAVGEIGLDGFVPDPDPERQIRFFHAQLKLARAFDLPVIMHVRKAQDAVLKGLRTFRPKSGIAHAFNGSFQQAGHFIDLGCALGVGGAMTFERALQIRRLARALPIESLVLETDAPDIAPAWMYKQRNEPMQLARIASVLADLRQTPFDEIARQTAQNARRALNHPLTEPTQRSV